MDELRALRDAHKKLIGSWLGESRHKPRSTSIEKRGSNSQTEILGYPEVMIAPIQNLDPTSPSFGTFLYMMDYDSLP